MARRRCLIFDFGNVIAFFDHAKAARQLAALGRTPRDPHDVYKRSSRPGSRRTTTADGWTPLHSSSDCAPM
jgi:hypothetical protein